MKKPRQVSLSLHEVIAYELSQGRRPVSSIPCV